jgi:hemolysin III
MSRVRCKRDPWIKDPFCGLSHGIGVLLSLAGLIALQLLADGRFLHSVSFAVYGVSLVVLYAASSLYHSLRVAPRTEAWLRRLDHCAIYLLIAGSYTPVCLVTLRGAWGWSLLGAVWSLAVIGIACSMFWRNAPHWWRVVLYVLMGWMVLVAFVPLQAALSPVGLKWLVAGGVIYSVGTIIFALDKPHLWPGRFSAHDLWHLFVMGGSACHFVVMARYVARA